ncbi:MAG TPA: PAS domain S-box protein, partial [Anaerolineales bacterium]|nr:PAS domain S-box protein [Anaerolineales bacterium]
DWQDLIHATVESRSTKTVEVTCNTAVYEIMLAPVIGGGYVNLYGMDITKRKRAEDHFNKAFHAGPNPLVISRQEDGRIETINDAFISLFDYSEEEAIGKTSTELGMFVNAADRQEAGQKLQREGFLRNFELDVRLKSGEVRNASLSVEMLDTVSGNTMLTMIQDITERRKAEQALRESEEKYRLLAEKSNDWIYWIQPDRNFRYISPSCERVTGFTAAEFMQNPNLFIDMIHPEDREQIFAHLGEVREGSETHNLDYRIFTKTNELRWISHSCDPVYTPDGSYMGRSGTNRDVTERKQAEEVSRRLTENLRRSNAELEQFAYVASHDLQEPLRKIETFGNLLLERAAQLDDQGRDYVQRMQNAAGRMRAMVDGLLQLSRITTQGQPFVHVDLSEITSDVLSDLEDQIRRVGGKVEIEPLPSVEGDPLQLRQLMQNLIGNGLKYHPPGTPPQVKVRAKQRAGMVEIFVGDKGIGFEQEDAERIFQPFQRLVGRGQYEGSGMGLAICRRIVERHGGNIAAFSKPKQGATFMIELPTQPTKSTKMS